MKPPVGMDGGRSSPRKRGCFHQRKRRPVDVGVFPAQAGVFLFILTAVYAAAGLPRASGGVSKAVEEQMENYQSSPRKRGCFQSTVQSSTRR